jgi:hypothetical protein
MQAVLVLTLENPGQRNRSNLVAYADALQLCLPTRRLERSGLDPFSGAVISARGA